MKLSCRKIYKIALRLLKINILLQNLKMRKDLSQSIIRRYNFKRERPSIMTFIMLNAKKYIKNHLIIENGMERNYF